MAQLCCISTETFTSGVNNIGDIVSVEEDSHTFSDTELLIFDIVEQRNMTRAEVKAQLNSMIPLNIMTEIRKGLKPEDHVITWPKYRWRVVDDKKPKLEDKVHLNIGFKLP